MAKKAILLSGYSDDNVSITGLKAEGAELANHDHTLLLNGKPIATIRPIWDSQWDFKITPLPGNDLKMRVAESRVVEKAKERAEEKREEARESRVKRKFGWKKRRWNFEFWDGEENIPELNTYAHDKLGEPAIRVHVEWHQLKTWPHALLMYHARSVDGQKYVNTLWQPYFMVLRVRELRAHGPVTPTPYTRDMRELDPARAFAVIPDSWGPRVEVVAEFESDDQAHQWMIAKYQAWIDTLTGGAK